MDARFRLGLERAWLAASAENTAVPLTCRDYMDGIWAKVCDEIDAGTDHAFPMLRSWQLTGLACGVGELTVTADSLARFAGEAGHNLTFILGQIEDRLQRVGGDKFLSLAFKVAAAPAAIGEAA